MNSSDWKILGTFWFSGPTIGLLTGAAITALFMPNPQVKEDCSVYKIAREVQTSYALKPPEPVVVKEACPETPKCLPIEVPAAQPEEKISDDVATRKKHHRRRWRRRWH